MDRPIIMESVRWQEEPTRIAVLGHGPSARVFLQTTSPKGIEGMCQGRPVEELPRILPIIGPAHHLAAARALDDLFAVDPPLLAQNIRAGLLKAQFVTHHLRTLFFLLSRRANPFEDFRTVAHCGTMTAEHRMLDEIMHHLALAQEAEIILGGRCAHSLTAVAGGVSRFLKEGQGQRLAEIAEACVRFGPRVADFFRNELSADGQAPDHGRLSSFPPLSMLALSGEEKTVVLKDPSDKKIEGFSIARTFEKIGLHREKWTFSPFAYVKEKGWRGLSPEGWDGLCFVGPLARLNSRKELKEPMAEQERRHLIERLGPFPHFSVCATYWALLVELIQASEQMAELFVEENLTGPTIRTIPEEFTPTGCGAVESPGGLIVHQYEVDQRGLVENIRVMDTAAGNNALRCLIAQKVVSEGMARGLDLTTMKSRIEVNLLPF